MDETASRAEAVARMNPASDRMEVAVRSFGELIHRSQPQISTTGEARYPIAIRIPNTTCVEMLTAILSTYCIPPRFAPLKCYKYMGPTGQPDPPSMNL
jgi:hypothetical protein